MEINPLTMGRQTGTPSQNLINPTKVPQFGHPQGYWKSIILDVLGIGTALLVGYTYSHYLTDGVSPWYVLAAIITFSVTSVLQVYLAFSISRRTLVIVGETAALVVFFILYVEWQVISAASAAVFVLLLWGYLAARGNSRNSLEVSFFGTTGKMLGKLTTAILLFMILIYAPQAQGQGIFVPRESFRTFFNWASAEISPFYPNLPLNSSFGSFASSVAKSELDNNPTFATMSPSAQNVAIQQAVNQLSGGVRAATGVAPQQQEPFSDVVYDYIVTMLGAWKDKFQSQFVIIWAVVVFLLLRTLGVIFVWIAQFIALITYEILLAAGFMHIGEATQTKEVVEY